MTEEIVKEEKEEVIEVNPVEEKASEMGWMPKEAWVEAGKDPGQWRSAELFVELEPLFGKIESLKREVRGTKQTLEAFKQHHAKVRETEYKHALEDLKTQKKGSAVTANLEIKLPNKINVEEATKISNNLKEMLIKNVESLEYVAIQIKSHDVTDSYFKPRDIVSKITSGKISDIVLHQIFLPYQ